MSKYPKISKKDFSFIQSSFGYYKVTYTSPVTGKSWRCSIPYISLCRILVDSPTFANLNAIKSFVKRYGYKIN